MKTNETRRVTKKLASLVLALAMAFTAVFTSVTPVEAGVTDVKYLYSSSTVETASANQEVKFPFTASGNKEIAFLIEASNPTPVTITIYDAQGNMLPWSDNPFQFIASDYEINDRGNYALYDPVSGFSSGEYQYGMTFSADTAFYIDIIEYSTAELGQTSMTLTKGFSKKISVKSGTVKSWSSKNSKIAKVDKKTGKVTAVKAGKTTITATFSDGSKKTCTVTVKDNKYSATKITPSDVSYNEYGTKAYSASFDKKGNLVVKVMIVNGGYGRMTKIPGFKVTVKNQNGKVVGTYKSSSFKVSVPSYSSKSYTVTIKKSSKLSSKTVDLRNSSINVDGGTATVYY